MFFVFFVICLFISLFLHQFVCSQLTLQINLMNLISFLPNSFPATERVIAWTSLLWGWIFDSFFFCFDFLIRICATISHRQVIRLCYHDCLRRKPRLNWNKCIILTCTTILVRTIHAFCLQTENRILKLVCMFGWMFESTIYTHHKKSYLQFFFSFVKLILK